MVIVWGWIGLDRFGLVWFGFFFQLLMIFEIGEYTPDWLSQQKDWLPEKDKKIWEDHSSEFRSKLDKLLKPKDINPKEVCIHGLFL